jgi:hypothetical protein
VTLVPFWLKALAVAMVAAVAMGLLAAWKDGIRDEGRAEVRAQWAAEREAQKDQALRDAAQNARETARRLERQQEAQNVRDQKLAAAERDARDARRGELRLREWADERAATARAAACDPTASGNRPAAGDPAGVLADVLGRADERAGLLAEYADRARIAGQQCEAAYDALTRQP